MNNRTKSESPNTLPELLTCAEVARILRVSPQLLRVAAWSGAIPGGRIIMDRVRFHRDTFLAWLNRRPSETDDVSRAAVERVEDEPLDGECDPAEVAARTFGQPNDGTPEEAFQIPAVLEMLNRTLRRKLGARSKINFEPSPYADGYEVYWGRLHGKAARAVRSAARHYFDKDFEDDDTWVAFRGFGSALAFLVHLNDALAAVA
jgi:hypothetical protein